MKTKKKLRILASLMCLVLSVTCAAGILAKAAQEKAEGKELTVAFTHDLHSHLDSFIAQLDGKEQEVGGFARLKTFIDETKKKESNTLVLDGGDFSMGTLYQTVFETQAAELRMLGYLGVDATTMGNHEFDYRTKGLSRMFQSAMDSGDTLPFLALCNVDWEATLAQPAGDVASTTDLENLKKTFDSYGIADYVMLKKGDVSIAVTGVFGKDALECAPTCELIFKDPVKAVKETVARIKKEENADIIICVSHSGTWEEEKKSEDEILAKSVPELDLIISGHTHSTLQAPIIYGNTAIVSTGEYGMRAGKVRLVQNGDGQWEVKEYELVPMTGEVQEDKDALEKIRSLGQTIDSDYLARFGYTRNQVLVYNPWKNPTLAEISENLQENAFTNLLADAYLYTINNIPELADDPVDVAVVPSGVIRDVFAKDHEITVSDVFNVFSLGIGPDGVPGYPLIGIYLTGAELKTAAEIDASISPLMTTAQLYMGGLSYTLNPHRMILNKVTEVKLCDMEGNQAELEDDKLYKVAADLYSGQMLGAVTDMSYGILSIVPKDASGKPIENLEDYIIYDDGQEVKAWAAVARYAEHLAATGDNGEIPEYYSKTQDRKVIDDDRSLGAILKNPSKIAIIIVCIVLAVIAIQVLLIVLIVKGIKKIRRIRHKREL